MLVFCGLTCPSAACPHLRCLCRSCCFPPPSHRTLRSSSSWACTSPGSSAPSTVVHPRRRPPSPRRDSTSLRASRYSLHTCHYKHYETVRTYSKCFYIAWSVCCCEKAWFKTCQWSDSHDNNKWIWLFVKLCALIGLDSCRNTTSRALWPRSPSSSSTCSCVWSSAQCCALPTPERLHTGNCLMLVTSCVHTGVTNYSIFFTATS